MKNLKNLEYLEYVLLKSAAGHDKGSWYIAVKTEADLVYIADGRRRKLANPKKKNAKHVEMTRKVVKLDYFTDKSLRKALWEYNFNDSENDAEKITETEK